MALFSSYIQSSFTIYFYGTVYCSGNLQWCNSESLEGQSPALYTVRCYSAADRGGEIKNREQKDERGMSWKEAGLM